MTSTSTLDNNDSMFDFDLDDLYEKLMYCDDTTCFSTANFATGSSRIIFPQKLHKLLQLNNHPEIISWLPDGQSFKIHNKIVFEKNILSTYFGGMQFRSFQRQMHLYAFARLDTKIKYYAYKHENFTRDNTSKLNSVRRTPGKNKVQFQPCSIRSTASRK